MTRRLFRSLAFAALLAAMLSMGSAPIRAGSFVYHFSEPSSGPLCGENVSGLLKGEILLAGRDETQFTAHINLRGEFVGDSHTFHLSGAGTEQFDSFPIELSFSGRAISEGGDVNVTFEGVMLVIEPGIRPEIVSLTFHHC
jgi:hypothetical protein